MKKEMDIRRERHRTFLMPVHLVVAKYQRNIFDQDPIEKRRDIDNDFNVELVEIDDERDHVHLRVNYPSKLAVSSSVSSLKGVSSRLLRRDRPEIAARDDDKSVLWTLSYFANRCGSTPISIIRQYIEQQQTPS